MKSTDLVSLMLLCELELLVASQLKRNRSAVNSLNLIPLLDRLNRIEADNRQSDVMRDQIRCLILRFSEYLPQSHPQARNEKSCSSIRY